ncbi:MAG: hypothetical protein IJO32_00505 [Bacilli bacterium]|nr:hypothetical protein [Bacilli bacterium]
MKENRELVSLDYEAECNMLRQTLNEQADEWAKKIDSIVYEKNIIIENQLEEIEFYKNIIKSMLHIK